MSSTTTLINYIMGKNTSQRIYRLLLLLSFFLIIVLIFKQLKGSYSHEGFVQNQRFLTKYNSDIYDDFYANIYDKIHKPEIQNVVVLKAIQMTQPTEFSLILDVGCGTGHQMKEMQNHNWKVFGIDKSEDMVNYALQKYPDLKIKTGDVKEPMMYDKHTFSHVLCAGFTIYQFKDKITVFRNIHYWLIPNGYFIVHLADKNKFDPIVPSGKPFLSISPQKYNQERINTTEIDFFDFKYKNNVNFNTNSKTDVVVTETFVDSLTHHVRQNEQTLYFTELTDILYEIQYCGFLLHSQINMKECGDEYQYCFIFEKIL